MKDLFQYVRAIYLRLLHYRCSIYRSGLRVILCFIYSNLHEMMILVWTPNYRPCLHHESVSELQICHS